MKVMIGIVAFFVILVTLAAIGHLLPNQQQNKNASPSITTSPQSNPSSTSTPLTGSPYVGVDYSTIGWFINNLDSYNYTYLVLNVTITNHGYQQINTNGINGFDVVINNVKYSATAVYPVLDTESNNAINAYFMPNQLPSNTLLNTGSITGGIMFQFGNANDIPSPPQIVNVPFILQYTVTYGTNTLFPPNAKVIINQVG